MGSVMIIVKSGPEEGAGFEEGLRLVAAMLGMDYMPVVVFVDAGVECLRPETIGDQVMGDYLKAAVDLAGIHALSESLESRGLGVDDLDLGLEVTPVDLVWLADMVAEVDTTVAF